MIPPTPVAEIHAGACVNQKWQRFHAPAQFFPARTSCRPKRWVRPRPPPRPPDTKKSADRIELIYHREKKYPLPLTPFNRAKRSFPCSRRTNIAQTPVFCQKNPPLTLGSDKCRLFFDKDKMRRKHQNYPATPWFSSSRQLTILLRPIWMPQ